MVNLWGLELEEDVNVNTQTTAERLVHDQAWDMYAGRRLSSQSSTSTPQNQYIFKHLQIFFWGEQILQTWACKPKKNVASAPGT
jgi:hypothetical protein